MENRAMVCILLILLVLSAIREAGDTPAMPSFATDEASFANYKASFVASEDPVAAFQT
jgi:hypothetical protein